jgi:hypothetical protein
MFPLVFGAIFLTVGIIPIWLAVRTFAKDRAIARWPRAPGRMTVSRVSSHTRSEKDQQGYYRRYTYHDPVVEYTYTVGGRELVGKQLTRVAVSSTSMPDLSRYPEGQDVSVYYDPNDPTIAYLEVRRSIGAIILCILGGAFVVPGILVPVLVLSCGA